MRIISERTLHKIETAAQARGIRLGFEVGKKWGQNQPIITGSLDRQLDEILKEKGAK